MAHGVNGMHGGAPDARLTELLRADTATAYSALHELRERHRPSVLALARLCTTSESAAAQLAAQVFTLAARETARGIDPGVPWRHQLLLLTHRSAATWAADERSASLEPSLLLVLNTAGPDGPAPPMLAPFRSLPSRAQGLVWYGVVEGEPAARTAALLGISREDVTYDTGPALQSLAQACLRSRLAASDDPRCGDFRRLIEEAVRPDTPRSSPDLHAHMALCAHCTTAYEELSALRDHPRTALAEGLLPWAGRAYVTSNAREPIANGRTPTGPWPPSRRFVLASAALGVALIPLLFFLLPSGGSPSQETAASATSTTPSQPPVTVTVSPPPQPTPSPSPTSRSPSPTRSSKPPSSPTPSPTPIARPPGGSYAQVVNVSSGLCLDIRDGTLEKGIDVITAPCTSSPTQRWRFDTDRNVLQSSADSDFCLDSRGDVDNGVGIWECASVDGANGDNLRFTIDPDGTIRPAIALATALTPATGDDELSLVALSGSGGQRWRAGRA